MKKSITALCALALTATPALAQMATQAGSDVRPGDCRPVFPVNDAAAPADVVSNPANPASVVKRRFLGLPFLLPLLLAAGGAAALGGGGNGSRSPA